MWAVWSCRIPKRSIIQVHVLEVPGPQPTTKELSTDQD